MKRSCLFLLVSVAMVFVLGFFVWSQRQGLLDAASDIERMAAAPVAVPFEKVTPSVEKVEEKELSETSSETESLPTEITETDEVDPALQPEESPAQEETAAEAETDETSSTPLTFNLAVPFTSQAPFGEWDLVHEDTCEEAALYMTDEFYKGTSAGQIAAATADTELLKIVEFEKALFGFFESTTALQISILAEQMYGYEKVRLIENPTVEDLKIHIAAGRPVIVPSAGRMLGNPNFAGEGPLYHALVLKGYTDTTFVTNDPGTRRGADYQYSFDTIMNAMHDWNSGDVENGAKVVVVIYPNPSSTP